MRFASLVEIWIDPRADNGWAPVFVTTTAPGDRKFLINSSFRHKEPDLKKKARRSRSPEPQRSMPRNKGRAFPVWSFASGFWNFFVGKEEAEDGSVVEGVRGAAEGEATLVAVDDAGGDPEAEAGAVEVLSGVEGLEDTSADGGGHAVASVGDGYTDARAA